MNKTNPYFSIIIPTYNSAVTIQRCLSSITHQTFKAFEILIIDGGSTDTTFQLIDQVKNSNPIKWFSESDEGIYDAMNKGVKKAKGEYLYFLGSDDTFYTNNVLALIADTLAKTDAKILYGNVLINGSNKWVKDGTVHAGEFDLKRILSNNICHQSIFYHNTLFKKLGGYNIKYNVFADYDFNLRCFAKYTFYYIDAIIANFSVGGASSQLTDEEFDHDKSRNIIKYFFRKLFTSSFIDTRLYIQQAALSKSSNLNYATRLYCLLAYSKLKAQSLLK